MRAARTADLSRLDRSDGRKKRVPGEAPRRCQRQTTTTAEGLGRSKRPERKEKTEGLKSKPFV